MGLDGGDLLTGKSDPEGLTYNAVGAGDGFLLLGYSAEAVEAVASGDAEPCRPSAKRESSRRSKSLSAPVTAAIIPEVEGLECVTLITFEDFVDGKSNIALTVDGEADTKNISNELNESAESTGFTIASEEADGDTVTILLEGQEGGLANSPALLIATGWTTTAPSSTTASKPMSGRGALTLFRVRGIRIAVDYSWFFVLFLVIFWLSGYYGDVTGAPDGSIEPFALAVVSALAFFGSILLHELGHAIVALRNGIGISEITLWLFGGLAHMQRDSDSAGVEFRVAAAGPAVTLLIAIVATAAGVGLAGSEQGFFDAMAVSNDADVSGVLAVIAWLASLNVIILIFNLIPAFPLDGGRILRALAWRLTGDRNKATRFAALTGQGFSYLFVAGGLVIVMVTGDVISGIWLALVGFLLGSAARGTVRRTEVESRIGDLSVSDVMDAEPVSIADDTTVERALDEFFLRYRWPWFPVTDAAQRFVGLIVREAADAVPDADRSTKRVGDVLEADSAGTLQVQADAPLDSLSETTRCGGWVPLRRSTPMAGCAGSSRPSRSAAHCATRWPIPLQRRRTLRRGRLATSAATDAGKLSRI